MTATALAEGLSGPVQTIDVPPTQSRLAQVYATATALAEELAAASDEAQAIDPSPTQSRLAQVYATATALAEQFSTANAAADDPEAAIDDISAAQRVQQIYATATALASELDVNVAEVQAEAEALTRASCVLAASNNQYVWSEFERRLQAAAEQTPGIDTTARIVSMGDYCFSDANTILFSDTAETQINVQVQFSSLTVPAEPVRGDIAALVLAEIATFAEQVPNPTLFSIQYSAREDARVVAALTMYADAQAAYAAGLRGAALWQALQP